MQQNEANNKTRSKANSKAIQQINFTGLKRAAARMYFIIKEAKETILNFSKVTIKALWFYFVLIKY